MRLHHDAAARPASGDEGARDAALCHGKYELLLDRSPARRLRCGCAQMDTQRSARAARPEGRKRAGDLDARRDVAFHPKKTRKLWIWRAYDPVARRTVAWIVGGRDDETCQKLLDKIGVEGKTFITDDWDGYHRLIPEGQLFTGKDLTVPIERDNSNIRHFLARFRRRTKVVSKSQEMVDLSLRLYHHLHDNLEALAEKLSAFQAIFG
jgi:insertion element IS1 protein InsB